MTLTLIIMLIMLLLSPKQEKQFTHKADSFMLSCLRFMTYQNVHAVHKAPMANPEHKKPLH